MKSKVLSLVFLTLGVFLVYGVYTNHITNSRPFHFGLDLSGGSYLLYDADTSEIAEQDKASTMGILQDIIERRINVFGVSEPRVRVNESSGNWRLSVELPGITDLNEAIDVIGATPVLEFKTEAENFSDIIAEQGKVLEALNTGQEIPDDIDSEFFSAEAYIDSHGLTGRYLEEAKLQFTQVGQGQLAGRPYIALTFNQEGAEIFREMTSTNIGKTIAIYLDGKLVSAPVVNVEITDGNAIIEGSFTPIEARAIVDQLNTGALPLPISLAETQTIGPTLGSESLFSGLKSVMIGFVAIAIVLILWYRLSGLLSIISLMIYGAIMLTLFQFIPVVLTVAGIAGFLVSLGIAVDGNILVFERVKEELHAGNGVEDALRAGFLRAWQPIRDAGITSLISGVILFYFGSSLLVGFALIFSMGVLTAFLSTMLVSRVLLFSFASDKIKLFFKTGFSK